MASVRAEIREILNIHGLEKQLGEVINLLRRLALENKEIALAYNLAGDLFMEQSLYLEDQGSEKSIRDGLVYYEQAAQLAPKCVETAAAHAGALLSLKLLDTAELVLSRGLSISDDDVVHPFVNHIGITPGCGTKDELIERARLRMRKDLQHIKEWRREGSIVKLLKQLTSRRAQCTTILSAAKRAGEKHGNTRGKLLYPHVVLSLLRTGLLMSDQLSDDKRDMVLESAMTDIVGLAGDFPNSLVIALCCAKLQVSLGFFDAAEKEFCRALSILNPDDPRDHEIPLGSTKGARYQDRILYITLEIVCCLVSLFGMIENKLSDEIKISVLSVKVDNLLRYCQNNQKVTDDILEAVDNFKANHSWISWRCWHDEMCFNFSASTPMEFLWHMWGHAYPDNSMLLPDSVSEKLSALNASHADSPSVLDLAKDDDGIDIICVKGLSDLVSGAADVLIQSIKETTRPNSKLSTFVDGLSARGHKKEDFDIMEKLRRVAGLLSKSEMETISQDLPLAQFLNYLSTLDLEEKNSEAFDDLEELWVRLLNSSAVDNHKVLMALVSTMKLGEMKEWIENQVAEAKVPVLVMASEDETLIEIPEAKGEIFGLENTVSAARPKRYAFMYGRRIRALTTLVDKNKMAPEGHFDPYMDKMRHLQFCSPDPCKLPNLVLCSGCFFERAASRRFS